MVDTKIDLIISRGRYPWIDKRIDKMKLNIETITLSVAGKDKGIIIKVDLKGSLDTNNTPEFGFLMSTIINGGAKKILLDIDDLQFLDSTGIGSLIAIAKKLRKENGEIAITRYTAQVLAILRPINIEKFIQFFPTVEEGINYLRSLDV